MLARGSLVLLIVGFMLPVGAATEPLWHFDTGG
jgi:hypothetical protein